MPVPSRRARRPSRAPPASRGDRLSVPAMTAHGIGQEAIAAVIGVNRPPRKHFRGVRQRPRGPHPHGEKMAVSRSFERTTASIYMVEIDRAAAVNRRPSPDTGA